MASSKDKITAGISLLLGGILIYTALDLILDGAITRGLCRIGATDTDDTPDDAPADDAPADTEEDE